MTLEEILFQQYLLGRDHESMSWRGEQREVGGEISEAKKQIEKMLNDKFKLGIKVGKRKAQEETITMKKVIETSEGKLDEPEPSVEIRRGSHLSRSVPDEA